MGAMLWRLVVLVALSVLLLKLRPPLKLPPLKPHMLATRLAAQ